jgi:hypothetical protein
MSTSAGTVSSSNSQSEIAQFLSLPVNRVDLNYAMFMGNSRIICMGDWHVGYSVKDEFIRITPELKERGVTHLAFELLSTNMQETVSRYHALRHEPGDNESEIETLRNKLVDHFFSIWADSDNEEEHAELRTMANKFTEMIGAAIANGMQVLAIEPPVPRTFAANGGYALLHSALEQLPCSAQLAFDQYWTAAGEANRKSSRDSLCSSLTADANWKAQDTHNVFEIFDNIRLTLPELTLFGLKLPRPQEKSGQFDQPWEDFTNKWRDQTWTRIVEDALTEPQSRVLVFSGAGHFGYAMPSWPEARKDNQRFNEILSLNGHDATVIGFAGGDYPRKMMASAQEEFGFPTPQTMLFTDAAAEAGVCEQTFAIKLQKTDGRESDWVVHLARKPEL